MVEVIVANSSRIHTMQCDHDLITKLPTPQRICDIVMSTRLDVMRMADLRRPTGRRTPPPKKNAKAPFAVQLPLEEHYKIIIVDSVSICQTFSKLGFWGGPAEKLMVFILLRLDIKGKVYDRRTGWRDK